MDNGMSYLDAARLARANPELTAEDIRNMSMADWARMTGRSLRPATLPETVTPNQIPAKRESAPTAPPEAVQDVPTPEPVSVRDMTPEQYAAYRTTIGMGQSQQYGVGILNPVSAPKASNGRHAMITSNVEPSPAISMDGRLEDRSARLDNRSAAQRFSTPGNSYQG